MGKLMSEPKNIEPDYKSLYEQAIQENKFLVERYEQEKQANTEYWQQIVDASTKEIEWLKKIINSILHI